MATVNDPAARIALVREARVPYNVGEMAGRCQDKCRQEDNMYRKEVKPRLSEGKVEIRATQEWVDRVDAEAARLGLKRSAYIRMVVVQALEAAGNARVKLKAEGDAK